MPTVPELEDVVLQLRQQLQEVEEQRMKAAQYGLQLLESQAELQNQLMESRAEFTTSIEVLEQDKYSLQREMELKNRMLESLSSDVESIKQQQKMQLSQQQEQLERSHAREINELKSKMEKLKFDLDEAQLCEKQLRHKLKHQNDLLISKSEELRSLSERAQETMSSEVMSLQVENMELEAVKVKLQEEYNEMVYRHEQLELANGNLRRHVERLEEEKEDQEKEAVSYSNSLEKARVVNQELQIQLDQTLQDAQNPNSKGNSLFAEVEDRRAMMERQLIGMRVQYQSLQKQHAFSRQQLHRMKMQIATLLQLKGSHSDPGQLERLQSMLAQKNNEIQALLVKLRRLEKQEMNHDLVENHEVEASELGDSQYYVELLKLQLNNAKKESKTLNDELSLQRMKALAESQRVLEVERKLYSNERQLKQCQSENMKLRIKLDEMKLKYEPEELKNRSQNRRKEKLPVEGSEEAQQTANKTPTSGAPALGLPPPSEKLVETRKRQTDKLHAEISVSPPNPATRAVPVTEIQVPEPETACNQPSSKEGKRVRIMEESSDVQVFSERSNAEVSRPCPSPRLPRAEVKLQMAEEKVVEKETEELKSENKLQRQKFSPVIHVSSQAPAEAQCAQQ
ncbi:protein Spindly isoform X1 [Callorhinchus milii]|uniref:Protein Spindly n=2 Tax=Callorhinchus milii TaxID=7868 RepID=V9KJQ6_CALMI|nr:protein Spindly isoform X1 [Callorhinchus milii]XP_042195368.1 protein Spindly isoform X1 [Callorhinchus milii]|eukprot:gi/632946152/ref/XP_007888417.1/ PREDICTED: protein Spindly [Callorhinchus milii]